MAVCFGEIKVENQNNTMAYKISCDKEEVCDCMRQVWRSSYMDRVDDTDWGYMQNAYKFIVVKYNGEWYPVMILSAFEEN